MKKSKVLFLTVCGLLIFACSRKPQYTTDVEVIAKGQELFEMQCTACHNFISSGIGPNLAGVTSEASEEWLRNFIRNPVEMIDGNDERARQLFQDYKTYMPPFTMLKDEDIDAILAYIHTHGEAPEMAGSAGLGPPLEDPIPDTIPMSDMVITLREIGQAPPTAEKPPVARINKMVPMPGKEGRQFVQDLNGLLYELKDGQFHSFLKIADHFPHFINQPGLATGFGSFAFHPDFNTNGIFYTNHTEDPKVSDPADFTFSDTIPRKVRWVLIEWKMDDPSAAEFSGTQRELFRVDMVTQIHGVQELAFNPLAKPGDPDYGMLYIGVGDGGSAENRYDFLVQDKSPIWGCFLRIDPAGRNSKNGKYGIPPDNPFASEMASGALGEIWTMGYRNPHRMIWDTEGSGNLIASDIGHHRIEELNIIEKGRNYGWPYREGTFLMDVKGNMDAVHALPENDDEYGFTYPVLQFDHDEAGAISNGYIYYGDNIPELRGKYFFGGIVNGRVFCVEAASLQLGSQAPFEEVRLKLEDGPVTTLRDLTGIKRVDLRFGIDAKKEMYIMTKADGKIYKITGLEKQPL